MVHVSSGSSILTRTTSPSNSVSGSSGATTSTSMVTVSPSSRPVPLSGSKVHTPHSGYDSISQSNNVPEPPMFSTVNVPVTVAPGSTSVQLNVPSQSRSGTSGCPKQ